MVAPDAHYKKMRAMPALNMAAVGHDLSVLDQLAAFYVAFEPLHLVQKVPVTSDSPNL
jgi:hypothetical protein